MENNVSKIIYKDKNNNVLREENEDGSWEESTYDSNNQLLHHKNSKGIWYEYTYIEWGLKASYKDCIGNSETYTYHPNNVLAKLTIVRQPYTDTFTYDDRGRETSYESSEGPFWTANYDAQGNKHFLDKNQKLIKTVSIEEIMYDEYY